MRTSDCDIVFVPGLGGAGPDHWQTRWEQKLSTARRVAQDPGGEPDREAWVERLVDTVERCRQPAVIVAHGIGVVTTALAAPLLPGGKVIGAFLVALPDLEGERDGGPVLLPEFSPLPRDPLPFPSLLVASRDDPYCVYDHAEDVAYAWGAAIVDAGSAGHIDDQSGYGPWPEGLMRFAGFLKRL